ncbi:S9 family peptidase [Methanoplanus endosymbiosus]|uniref:Prolyl oligopeptidase family serine peptidase n=1 Tax=Methanoplanus endosymbiosus TaxID=33865 RepID=A0A9E7PK12_9EURY|nr:prolyl oligopeptidase family serine peptidase [Methanoplanus endosymbiosus]UUX91369.1 prolyl oligopeptidase family serine peptidase [Methanoplanus endosymbiosus]
MSVTPASGEKSDNLTIEDLLHMEYAGMFTLSPDGSGLVYLKTEGTALLPEYINGTVIYYDLRTGREYRLSGEDETARSCVLSPKGRQAAYTAVQKESKDTVLKIVSLASRTAYIPQNISPELPDGFSWLNEDELIYTGSVSNGAEKKMTGGYYDDTFVVDEKPGPEILKKYSLITGITEPLSSNDDVITMYVPSPDGNYILYKSTANPDRWTSGPVYRYVLLDTATGAEKLIFSRTEGGNNENAICWAPDSSVIYIERFRYGGMTYPMLYTADLLAYYPKEGKIEEVPLKWDKGLHIDRFNYHVEITPFNGGFFGMLANGTNPQTAVFRHTDSGWESQILSGTHQGNIFALASSSDGNKVVYDFNSADTPGQFFAADVTGSSIKYEVQITDLNSDILPKIKGNSGIVHFTGALGDEIEGVVRYPADYIKGRQYPLVFVIHGGPAYTDFDSWRDTWEFPYHLITDMGAVALSVNYHGSLNYGFDFAESIEDGHYYDLPAQDLISGKEYLAETGITDVNRTGSTGWSNGGILTLDLITWDTSLKAAVCGAGTAEYYAELASTDGTIMAKRYFGESPFKNPRLYENILPIYRAENVTTPLLMMSGTKDSDVETSSAVVTYRTFYEESSAPVKFIMFPGESHSLRNYVHQYRKVQEELGWLNRYLIS